MPIPRPLCRPTPYVGHAEAARWVSLTFHQCLNLKVQLDESLQFLLQHVYKPFDRFPLTAEECAQLVERIQEQLPVELPITDIELSIRFLESELYQLSRWRNWVENHLGNLLEHTDTTTIGGYITGQKIEETYRELTEIRRRLAPPLVSG